MIGPLFRRLRTNPRRTAAVAAITVIVLVAAGVGGVYADRTGPRPLASTASRRGRSRLRAVAPTPFPGFPTCPTDAACPAKRPRLWSH
ncbi:hypothetical protein SAMN04489713_104306 [Actinomadura madurae]|uniref:Uncharacterized protein n=1 Tax=Actinomadura madurae TaxID=1993 RepID=A0A1I5EVE3_9ACTN|nr:hypothetical protein SAMN04489713_104306 [Actinomadura madurae]